MHNFEQFRALLEEHHEWPTHYNFKFLIVTEKKTELMSHLEGHEVSERFSKNGKYLSITSIKHMETPDHVIEVYKNVSTIEGIMTL